MNVSIDLTQARPRTRKSPWNLLLVLFSVLAIGGTWIGLVFLFEAYRRSLIPSDAFLSSGTRVGNILMFVAPAFASIVSGLLVANFLAWLIPSARTALDREASASGRPAFRATQLQLARFGIPVVVVTLPFVFLGANNVWAVSHRGVDYQPMFSAAARHYAWRNVEEIDTGCYFGRQSVTYQFIIRLGDGTAVDLMEESPRNFVRAYPQLRSALAGQAYRFDAHNFTGSCAADAPLHWREILSRLPTGH